MTSDIRALAIRFADLWAVDHHQMVDEIYSPAIHMESMTRPTVIEGAAALHALEDGLAARIPDHRHELVRVLVDGRRAFLETTIVGPTTGDYAQAAVWWWLDDVGPGPGQVVGEIGWFDWTRRSTDSRRSRGTVARDDHRVRDQAWYATEAARLAAAWNADPSAAVRALPSDVTVTIVGLGEAIPATALAHVAARRAAGQSEPTVTVVDTLGEGATFAVLCTLTAGEETTRGTVVVTVDVDDRIAGLRLYLDLDRIV